MYNKNLVYKNCLQKSSTKISKSRQILISLNRALLDIDLSRINLNSIKEIPIEFIPFDRDRYLRRNDRYLISNLSPNSVSPPREKLHYAPRPYLFLCCLCTRRSSCIYADYRAGLTCGEPRGLPMTLTCICGDSKLVAEPGDWALLDARLFDLETT